MSSSSHDTKENGKKSFIATMVVCTAERCHALKNVASRLQLKEFEKDSSQKSDDVPTALVASGNNYANLNPLKDISFILLDPNTTEADLIASYQQIKALWNVDAPLQSLRKKFLIFDCNKKRYVDRDADVRELMDTDGKLKTTDLISTLTATADPRSENQKVFAFAINNK